MISVIGLGFVGSAMTKSFELKGNKILKYDKYKKIGSLEICLKSKIIFLALPTPFINNKYDISAIIETCDKLQKCNYNGLVVLKSTVEPETINNLENKYNLNFCHNPEFLTARTAFTDFHNQIHIVLGKGEKCDGELFNNLLSFYKKNYPQAYISTCSTLESESMKIFLNCFYATKVQFFNELYLTCQSNGSNYKKIKEMMLLNNWINPMHTDVPGPDGKLSYGGLCFPKDTNALNSYMKYNKIPNKVLEATIKERDQMREDHDNCFKTI